MKTVSRQYLYQERHIQEGLCSMCSEPLAEGSRRFCTHHWKTINERQRNAYRQRKGIPIKAPIRKGNPAVKEWAKMEPDKYMVRYRWALVKSRISPEELEAKAQDLLIFANMLRKSK